MAWFRVKSPPKRSKRRTTRRISRAPMEWVDAPEVHERLSYLVATLSIDWVDPTRIYCFRSVNTTSRAIARIWGFSKIWQLALKTPPAYCLEVVSERFDKLPAREQDKVLLHEMAHIPKNFSGALLAHTHGKGGFHDKLRSMETAYDCVF